MQTKILPITPESLEWAKHIIDDGGVVAMPTETVYGLGGNAFNDDAVRKIFEVKGRPNNNPLIAHIHEEYDLSQIIDYDPPYAKALRDAFLPGPLTLVYPSKGKVSPFVSCGLDTLAIRVPAHVGARAFLKKVGVPIVAPSANLSRHVSPTSAKHVFDDFDGKISLILDGGECVGGIESTVCDCTGEYPVILRPGLVTREMIEKVVGRCDEYTPNLENPKQVKSPGMLYKHYAPRCKRSLVPNKQDIVYIRMPPIFRPPHNAVKVRKRLYARHELYPVRACIGVNFFEFFLGISSAQIPKLRLVRNLVRILCV